MSASRIRSDYEQLKQIAQGFQKQADQSGNTLRTLKQQMQILQGGDWIGKGADAFYQEMDSAVLPSMQRLSSALNRAATVTQQISQLVKQAEEDAARVLTITNSPGGGSANGGGAAPSGGGGSASGGGSSGGGGGGGTKPAPSAVNAFDGAPISLKDAPASMTIPQSLKDGMQKGWDASFPGGKSQEQGGILVKKADGTLEWRPGAAGTSGAFSPNYGDLKSGETLVAVGHTHPYDKSEGGHTNVAFSDQDIARLVYVNEPVHMVQAGEGQFALVRTKEFDDRVSKLNDTQKRALFDEMKAEYQKVFTADKGKGTLAERSQRASAAVAKKYDLGFYTGKGGTLSK